LNDIQRFNHTVSITGDACIALNGTAISNLELFNDATSTAKMRWKWIGMVVAYSKYYTGIRLKSLTKTT
jgi:hypothetical protein